MIHSGYISLSSAIICLVVLVELIVQRATTSILELLVLMIMVAVSSVIEVVYQRLMGKTILSMHRT